MISRKNFIRFCWVLVVPFLLSCGEGKQSSSLSELSVIPLRHTSFLSIEEDSLCKIVTVKNPWDSSKVLHRYVLVSRDVAVPSHLPEGTLLRIPLERVTLSSTVHYSLLKELGADGKVNGMCDVSYITSTDLQARIAKGDIVDMGSSMNIDVEKVMAGGCDAVFLSPFNQGNYGAIAKTNIPIVECADYMETSPLARAEWMRFYALLFGRERTADSLFAAIESQYYNLKDKVSQVTDTPKVLMDVVQSGGWYQPGTQSTIGRLIADAGGCLALDDNKQSGSVNLSFEKVFHQARNADVWLVRYSSSQPLDYASFAALHDGYNQFEAWKQRKVWVCDPSNVPFFEETPFHPELLLIDFISILHPEVMEEASHRYFTPLP